MCYLTYSYLGKLSELYRVLLRHFTYGMPTPVNKAADTRIQMATPLAAAVSGAEFENRYRE